MKFKDVFIKVFKVICACALVYMSTLVVLTISTGLLLILDIDFKYFTMFLNLLINSFVIIFILTVVGGVATLAYVGVKEILE